jgi:hypothetical protein
LIGYIGLIKSSKLKKYDLQAESIYCLTINLESLLTTYVQPTLQFEHVSKLMPIYKDVSFMIHHLEKINNLLTSLNTLDFIHSYEFIDRYQINAEQISYTIRFNFNNAKGTDNRTIDNYLKEVERRIIENHATIRK